MRKKLVSLPIMLLFVLALAGMVYSTCTVNTPGASAKLSGATYSVNVSMTLSSVLNCSMIATSAKTGGSITADLFNLTRDPVCLNATVNTMPEEDSNDWSFAFTCYNFSGSSETCTRSSVTIDNTIPIISGCSIENATAANGTISESSFVFFCTVWNATSCNSYWMDSTANAFASTAQSGTDYSLNAVTFTSSYDDVGTTLIANLKSAGDKKKTLYFDCSDGTNTTVTSTYEVMAEGLSKAQEVIKKKPSLGVNPFSSYSGKNKNKSIMMILLVLGAVVLLAGGFVYNKKK